MKRTTKPTRFVNNLLILLVANVIAYCKGILLNVCTQFTYFTYRKIYFKNVTIELIYAI